MLVAQEIILGNRNDENTVFRWKTIHVNLPGRVNYDPSSSWFTKVQTEGALAVDVLVYVDDI
jgi:hypothetical protein